MQSADLSEGKLSGASLLGTALRGAVLLHSQLQGADLSGAGLAGADLAYSQLQAANLMGANLQGVDLNKAQLGGASLRQAHLQGANLVEANLQGADLSAAELQGAVLSRVETSDCELLSTLVFRTDITETKFDASVLRSVNPKMEKHGKPLKRGSSYSVSKLTPTDLKSWIAAATEFVTHYARSDIADRFNRLEPTFQTAEQDAEDEVRWKDLERDSEAADPTGMHHRSRMALLLGDLACSMDGAPHVARGLINHRLWALGDQLEAIRGRLRTGRSEPTKCPGVAGFTESDWHQLDAIEP